VLGCSRLAGLRDTAWSSSLIAVAVLGVGVATTLLLTPVPGASTVRDRP
jgi:hypothetical protein